MARNPDTLETVIAARLVALIEKAGTSVRAVSLGLGRTAHDLHRRLATGYADRRPLRFEDAEAICAFLGVSPLELLRPVLLSADLRILTWIAERGGEGRAALASDVFEGARASLDRLVSQALVTESAHGALTITRAGSELVHATPKEV